MIPSADDAVINRGPADLSLPAIAARAQLGDRGALEELLRRLQPQLGEHIRGIVGDDDIAADVLQETLFIVCRRLRTVREVDWVRAWAYRISTREAYRVLRRLRHPQEQALDDIDELQDPSDGESGIDEEILAQLAARLAALPPAAQIVLRMHYLQSLTQQEVAEALEIPIGTVKSRLAYGLMCLRKMWVM